MKINMKYTGIVLLVATVLFACKKDDYIKGGTLHNSKVNMSTYDYLKSHPAGLFDTFLLLVDKSNVKEKINQAGVSFFAPTDYAVNNYLARRTAQEQNIDPNRKWTIDSMFKYDLPKFADSIDVYIVPGAHTYENLTQNGKQFATKKTGTNCVLSYEETFDPALGYNPNVSTVPRIVYYTLLLQPIPPPIIANEIDPNQGVRTRVQTSGLESTTGMIHVLNNGHRLFFRN
jgi:hypothetical protein